jgi:lipoate-protein ligase A
MRLLDLTLSSAAENLALDEALLLEAEAGRGGEVLRLWEWSSPAVVLGASGVLGEDVDEKACQADRVPILRRASGGGTVLLGRGCLCYSLVLAMDGIPALAGVRSSYQVILSRLADALVGLLPDIIIAGISDLAAQGRKFAGSAQQRKRFFLLHHGTILHRLEISLLGRYLREPQRQPDYRAGRTHGDFVQNLPCSVEELRDRLRTAWRVEEKRTNWPVERMRDLLAQKYAVEGWIRRR